MFKKKPGGAKVPHYKDTAAALPVRLPVPKTVTVPMLMHIGAPAEPCVLVKDTVKVGQLIGKASGFLSSPVYSGVSGTVKKIEDVLNSGGRFVKSVVIETDGEQTMAEFAPPVFSDRESFIAAVRESGVVGLGGAGFPTAVKLAVKNPELPIDIVINGAECEPFVTSDTRTMLDDTELIFEGIGYIQKYFNIKSVIVGIESNKPQCIKQFEALSKNTQGVFVKKLIPRYPQGGEKVLIHSTTGKIVPEGGLPIDVGVVVLNCTTLAAIARYIKTGVPLFEKCVTVSGDAVREPKNVIAPVGTPMRELFEFCGGFSKEPKKVLYGGPMMGIAVPDLDQPVLKTTNAVLAFSEEFAGVKKTTACIRCGKCIDGCPMGLMPTEIDRAFGEKNFEKLKVLKVNLCMECGSCSFICPAGRLLVETNKLAKAGLREFEAAKTAKEKEAARK